MIYTLALLLPLSFAALVSEYAGVLAVFLEGFRLGATLEIN